MISILWQAGEEQLADAIASELETAMPTLPKPRLLASGQPWGGKPEWDDVLIVLFRSNMPDAGLKSSVDSYRDQHPVADPRGAAASTPGGSVLPLSLDVAVAKPPPPIALIKSMHWDGSANVLRALVDRIEVLLGLAVLPGEQRIFISYRSGSGTALATDLHDRLSAAGFAPWLDEAPDNLPLGGDVQQIIHQQLRTAAVLILIDTPDVVDSDWIAEEVDSALAQFIPVLPVIPGGRRTSHFPAISGYERRALVQPQQAQGAAAVALSADDWQHVHAELSLLLLSGYRRRMRILNNAQREFASHNYAWNPLDIRRRMYHASKQRPMLPTYNVIAHCLIHEPTDIATLKAYEDYLQGRAGTPPPPDSRLCIYDRERILSKSERQQATNGINYILAHFTELPTLISSNFARLV